MSDSPSNSSTASNCTSDSASTESSSTIFSLPDLDFALATWCMIALIAFTILFETALHRLERSLTLHTHYLKVLARVYKELMVLGFISFAILICIQVLPLSESTIQTLEFVHVWFFFIALLYALHVLVYLVLARRDKRRYDVATFKRIPDLLEQHRSAQAARTALSQRPGLYAALRHRLGVGHHEGWVSAVLSSIYQSSDSALYSQMSFHIVRSLFIRTYALPSDFEFAK